MDIQSQKYIMILKKLLIEIGLSEEETNEVLLKFSIDLGGIILGTIYEKLQPKELEELKAKIQKSEKKFDKIMDLAKQACNDSANKLNFQDIVDTATIDYTNIFARELFSKMTEPQKKHFNDTFKKIEALDPKISKLIKELK